MDNRSCEVGYRIRSIRKELNLTQGSLAERIGVTQIYINMIERGARGASLNVLQKISALSGYSIDDILYGDKKADDKNMGTYLSIARSYEPMQVADALQVFESYLKEKVGR